MIYWSNRISNNITYFLEFILYFFPYCLLLAYHGYSNINAWIVGAWLKYLPHTQANQSFLNNALHRYTYVFSYEPKLGDLKLWRVGEFLRIIFLHIKCIKNQEERDFWYSEKTGHITVLNWQLYEIESKVLQYFHIIYKFVAHISRDRSG